MTTDIQDHILPIESIGESWKIWGIPSSIDWWKQQTVSYTKILTKHRNGQESGGRSCFASLVIGAIEEVQLWIKAGVQVKDRRWVDIGGGNGYYSIALKLLGAKSVCLLDVDHPCKWATPVLNAVGVDIRTADGGNETFNDVDSIVLLYVPDLELINVFQNYPDMTQAVISSGMFDNDFADIAEWKSFNLSNGKQHFTMGDGMAVFSHNGVGMDDAIDWYKGEKIANIKTVKRRLDDVVKSYIEPEDGNHTEEPNSPNLKASTQVPF